MNRALKPSAAPVEQSTGDRDVVNESRYLRTPDICHRFGISRWTWRTWVRSGIAPRPVPTLPGHPRWRVEDIDRFERGSRYFASHRSPRRTNQRVSRELNLVHDVAKSDGGQR